MLLGLAVLTGGADGCCPSLGAPSVHQQPHRDLVFASWVCSAFVSGSDPSFCWGHWHQPCCPVSAPQAALRSCSLNPGLPQHCLRKLSQRGLCWRVPFVTPTFVSPLKHCFSQTLRAHRGAPGTHNSLLWDGGRSLSHRQGCCYVQRCSCPCSPSTLYWMSSC